MPIPLRELACPACLGGLDPCDERQPIPSLECPRCDRVYSAEAGFLDFLGTPGDETPSGAGLRGIGPRLMHSPALARVYERLWRPFFVAVASAGGVDYATELAQIREWLAPARGGAVVDLSCGPGFTGRRLAQSGAYARVIGVDWSVAMLRHAVAAQHRGRVPEARAMLLVRADVVRMPFAPASIAGVHAGAALHLWPDPPGAIAEAARVLRPGGVLIASTFVHPRAAPRVFADAFTLASGARPPQR